MMKLVLAAVVLVVFLEVSSAYFPPRRGNSRQIRPAPTTPGPQPTPTDPEDPDDGPGGHDPLWWMDKQRKDGNNKSPANPGNSPDVDGNGPDGERDVQTSGPDHTSGKRLRGGRRGRRPIGNRPSRRPTGRPGRPSRGPSRRPSRGHSRRPSRGQSGRPGNRRPPPPPPTQVDPPVNGGEGDEEWIAEYPVPGDASGSQPPVGNGRRRPPGTHRGPPRRRPGNFPDERPPAPPQVDQPDNGGLRDDAWDGKSSGPLGGNDNQPSDGRRPPGNRRPSQRGPKNKPNGSRPTRGPSGPRGNNRRNDRFGGGKPSRGNSYGRPNNNNNNRNSNDVPTTVATNEPADQCPLLAEEGSCMFYNHPLCFQKYVTGCRPYPFQAEIVCTRSELRNEFDNKGEEYIEAFRQCTIGKLVDVDDCDGANTAIQQGLASSDCIFQKGLFCEVVEDPDNCLALFHIFGFSESGQQGELQDDLFESFNRFVSQCPQAARQSYIDNFSSKFFDEPTTTPPMWMMGAGGD